MRTMKYLLPFTSGVIIATMFQIFVSETGGLALAFMARQMKTKALHHRRFTFLPHLNHSGGFKRGGFAQVFSSERLLRGSSSKYDSSENKIIPITVLSGFLGSGKTTLLQHMLSNNEGLKIAVVVNDVASVNIDSKLVRGRTADDDNVAKGATPAGIVELQNGCACCSISGELLSSVSELMTLSDLRQDDDKFDHIVVEMSGVAEPRSVRNIFQEAMMYDMPLMDRVQLDTLVTVVDCSTFLDFLKSSRLVNTEESPELFYRSDEEKRKIEEESDIWMEGMPPSLAYALNGSYGMPPAGFDQGSGVCGLLVEQTEVADVILLNKMDLLSGEVEHLKQVITALNPRAKVISTTFGRIQTLDDVLASAKGDGVAMEGVVDDHKDFVIASDAQNCSDPECTNPLHGHDHSHGHSRSNEDSRDDGLITEDGQTCQDPECTNPHHTHDHSHGHFHSHDQSNNEVELNTSSNGAVCYDPDCQDHSHSHSHRSENENSLNTQTHAGIGTYVYRARRPFHPSRLLSALQKLPIVRGVPSEKGSAIHMDDASEKVFQQILRSKGFAWTADSNVKALYWSHAGCSFEMQCLGRWWATLPKHQWPDEATDDILADFDSPDHEESAATDTSSTVGDRRQEIVFIGTGLGSKETQSAIRKTLDSCLLNDDEWDCFRSQRTNEALLMSSFENLLEARMLT
mmetsp:Transcript_22919/g.46052  ORF Transcript_22919/g.46052 Transcript_22919/m.46052 type:complete len:686 (-) Transcript_22919:75-2132(-)